MTLREPKGWVIAEAIREGARAVAGAIASLGVAAQDEATAAEARRLHTLLAHANERIAELEPLAEIGRLALQPTVGPNKS